MCSVKARSTTKAKAPKFDCLPVEPGYDPMAFNPRKRKRGAIDLARRMLIEPRTGLMLALAAWLASCAAPSPQVGDASPIKTMPNVEQVPTLPPVVYAIDPPKPSEPTMPSPPEPKGPSGLRNTFAKRAPCHSLIPGRSRIGPSLAGVYGRKAGAGIGFRYSAGMVSSGLVWDVATLDRYLTRPRDVVPDGNMTFSGLSDPAARAEVIAYLQRF